MFASLFTDAPDSSRMLGESTGTFHLSPGLAANHPGWRMEIMAMDNQKSWQPPLPEQLERQDDAPVARRETLETLADQAENRAIALSDRSSERLIDVEDEDFPTYYV